MYLHKQRQLIFIIIFNRWYTVYLYTVEFYDSIVEMCVCVSKIGREDRSSTGGVYRTKFTKRMPRCKGV